MSSCCCVISICWCCSASCERITASCWVIRSRWVAMSARAPRAGPKTSARNPARTTVASPKATWRSARGVCIGSAGAACGLVALDGLVDDLDGLGRVERFLLCLERLLLVGQCLGRRHALTAVDDLLLSRLDLLCSCLLLGGRLVDLVLALLGVALDLLLALGGALLGLRALRLRGLSTIGELFARLLPGRVGDRFQLAGLAQLRNLRLTKPAGLDQRVVPQQRTQHGLHRGLETLEGQCRRPLLVVLLAVGLGDGVEGQPRRGQVGLDDGARQVTDIRTGAHADSSVISSSASAVALARAASASIREACCSCAVRCAAATRSCVAALCSSACLTRSACASRSAASAVMRCSARARSISACCCLFSAAVSACRRSRSTSISFSRATTWAFACSRSASASAFAASTAVSAFSLCSSPSRTRSSLPVTVPATSFTVPFNRSTTLPTFVVGSTSDMSGAPHGRQHAAAGNSTFGGQQVPTRRLPQQAQPCCDVCLTSRSATR